jgi:hypothetical protein
MHTINDLTIENSAFRLIDHQTWVASSMGSNQWRLIGSIGRPLSPHRFRIDTDQDAGPASRGRMIPQRPQHCLPPLRRRR